MIEGVEVIKLTTHADERGFFREVLRLDNIEKFGQWSHSSSFTGTIKAWHIHQVQTDWFYCPIGFMKVVLCDMRHTPWPNLPVPEYLIRVLKFDEYLLGDNQPAQVLCIPPGVAHGLKVLQGPAHLFYVTSHSYNPDDEGRIPFDALGYDWHKVDIK